MWLSPLWLGSLFDSTGRMGQGLPARRRGGSRPRRRPTRDRQPLEALEDRCLLSFNPVASLTVGTNPQAVVTGDFNNDGKLDLATANAGSNTVSVLLGNGAGGFGAAVHSAAGANPASLAVGDLNADGKMDLAVVNSAYGTVSVLLGKGDGSFIAPTSVAIGSDPLSVAVGDFNSDGTLDLAVSSNTAYPYYYGWYYGYWNQGHVNVLLGDGAGGFSDAASYYTNGGAPFGVAVADVDADGNPDVLTANEFGSVSVLMGNGDGTLDYWSGNDFGTGWYARAVTAGDFTGDGVLDLATAGSTVNILTGVGDGTFLGGGLQSVDSVAIAATDFNGDGKLDVSAVDPWTSTLSVLLGRGDGTLLPPLDYTVDSGPAAVAVGDFNGDGRPDVVAANAGSSTVSVLLNNGVWPAANAPSLSVGDVTIVEGNTGVTNAVFKVTLSAAYDKDVIFRYATEDVVWSSAIAGTDYAASTGEVTIRAGQTTAQVIIPIFSDRSAEPTENFLVLLSDSANAFIIDGEGVATILDDEPRISISNVVLSEGNGKGTTAFKFTISLSMAYDQPVTVNYATVNGTATAGSDYLAQSGSITFAPGETTKTITIAIKPDKQQESNETFYVDLSAASSNTKIEKARGVGTISDDDRHGKK